MNAIQIFEHVEFGEVRVVLRDGVTWFVAKDICEVLGYTNPSKAIKDHCKSPLLLNYNDSLQLNLDCSRNGILIIPESDLYRLIIKSKLPAAEKFESWVMEEVLPSIRKKGSYTLGLEHLYALGAPRDYYEAAVQLVDSLTENKKLQAENTELTEQLAIAAPKVRRTDAVTGSKKNISVGTLANILNQNGYSTGQNRLFRQLREDGYLMSRDSRRNHPYQRFIDSGLFFLEEVIDEHTNQILYVTKITGKGQLHLVKRYLDEDMVESALEDIKNIVTQQEAEDQFAPEPVEIMKQAASRSVESKALTTSRKVSPNFFIIHKDHPVND